MAEEAWKVSEWMSESEVCWLTRAEVEEGCSGGEQG